MWSVCSRRSEPSTASRIVARLIGAPPRTASCVVPGDLGGQNHLVAPAAAGEPAAEDLLGPPHGLGPDRVDRVDLGGVPEEDATLQRHVHLGVALGLGVLAAPGHRPEAELRDSQAGPAKRYGLHVGSPEDGLFWAGGRRLVCRAGGGKPAGSAKNKLRSLRAAAMSLPVLHGRQERRPVHPLPGEPGRGCDARAFGPIPVSFTPA